MKTCANCGRMFRTGERVIVLRQVMGIVAPDDPEGYVLTLPTSPEEVVHNRCPAELS